MVVRGISVAISTVLGTGSRVDMGNSIGDTSTPSTTLYRQIAILVSAKVVGISRARGQAMG